MCAARVAYEASVHAYTRALHAHAPRTPLARPSQVAGVGLADHAKLDSVGVLTLVSMFAINLPAAVSVECQGDITPDFQNVIDAIPSEQAYPYPLPLPLRLTQARKPQSLSLSAFNVAADGQPCELTVDSDLMNLSGAPTVAVAARPKNAGGKSTGGVEYVLTLTPSMSGTVQVAD